MSRETSNESYRILWCSHLLALLLPLRREIYYYYMPDIYADSPQSILLDTYTAFEIHSTPRLSFRPAGRLVRRWATPLLCRVMQASRQHRYFIKFRADWLRLPLLITLIFRCREEASLAFDPRALFARDFSAARALPYTTPRGHWSCWFSIWRHFWFLFTLISQYLYTMFRQPRSLLMRAEAPFIRCCALRSSELGFIAASI